MASVVDVEREAQALLDGLASGRRPTRDAVTALRHQASKLARTDGSIPSWRLADLDASLRELDRAGPPTAPIAAVPAPRRPGRTQAEREAAPPSQDLEARFEALRRRVDALHDLVKKGQRPTPQTFDDLQDQLVAHRRLADGPEIRPMLDDIRTFRRTVIAVSRSTRQSGSTSSRAGRGFWRQAAVSPPRRREVIRRRGARSTRNSVVLTQEQARLVDESRRLRERADSFAAAVPSGRRFPQREADRLFLHFKQLRPHLDCETRALNDVAVRRLEGAVLQVRQR